MWWLGSLALQIALIALGIRKEQRSGNWSWGKFTFVLGFGLMESILILIPIVGIDQHSVYFGPALIAVIVVAGANFVWMIVVARRWKLPDGRTGLEAYREEQLLLREAKRKL